MYSEDDFVQLSALQHFLFCQRQCALAYIEQVWAENLFTAQGRVMHENAHEERFEQRKDMRIERGVPLRSFALGLIGKADVVEFHKIGKLWAPYPVEYKRGKPKADDCDKVQLCAQALCLEEMLNVSIPAGALYYGKTRHRLNVEFNDELRKETIDTAHCLHEFIEAGKTPKPDYLKKCESCSLVDVCMPKPLKIRGSVEEYIQRETSDL